MSFSGKVRQEAFQNLHFITPCSNTQSCLKTLRMKKLLLALVALVGIASVSVAQDHVTGNGKMVTQKRSVSSFDAVNVSGGMQVLVKQAATISVQVEADENLQEYIETEVSGNKLTIRYRNKVSIHGGKVKVYITVPTLNGASISGSGSMSSESEIPSSGEFKAAISGSGNIRMQTGARNVEARISGSGNIELGGNANDVDVVISGSGSFKGYNLKSKDVSVTISGSGNVETNVDGPLDAKISGSGSVYYKGNAAISLKSSGSGKVKRAE